jgi:hypothetical protein
MPFADDLLDQARHLGNKGDDPTQASLRRSVSTAYYALFHLLIDDAVSKWAVARQRGALGRTFEHQAMRTVCEDYVRNFYSAGNLNQERSSRTSLKQSPFCNCVGTPPITTSRLTGRAPMRLAK